MRRVVYGRRFLDSVERLPIHIQLKLDHLIELVATNPYSPTLHTKKLHGEFLGCLAFRITRDWRVMFQFSEQDTIVLLIAEHRKDVYR